MMCFLKKTIFKTPSCSISALVVIFWRIKKKKTTTNNPHGTRKIALNPSLRAGGVFEAKTGVKHHRAPAVEIVTELVG